MSLQANNSDTPFDQNISQPPEVGVLRWHTYSNRQTDIAILGQIWIRGWFNEKGWLDSRRLYMVRNHQDGYHHINLSLFLYTETSIILEKFIGQRFPDRDGRGIARDIKKIISIFITWQKMVPKFGQFKKLKWPFFLLQCCTFFVENIQKCKFFGKITWSMNSGWRWAVDC